MSNSRYSYFGGKYSKDDCPSKKCITILEEKKCPEEKPKCEPKKKCFEEKKICKETCQWVEIKRKCCEKVDGICLDKKLLNSQLTVTTVGTPVASTISTYRFVYEIVITNNTCQKLVNIAVFDNFGGFITRLGESAFNLNVQVLKSRGGLVINDNLLDDITSEDIEPSLTDPCKSWVKPCSVSSIVYELTLTFTNSKLIISFNNTSILEACLERKESKPKCPGECDSCCKHDDCCLKKDKIQPLVARNCFNLVQVDRRLL